MIEAISAANSAVKASTAIKGQQRPELTVSDIWDFQFRLVAPLPVPVPAVEVPVPVTPTRVAAAVSVPVCALPPVPTKVSAPCAVPHASAAVIPAPVAAATVLPARVAATVSVRIMPAALAALEPDTVPRSQWPKVDKSSDGTDLAIWLTDKTSIAGLLCACLAHRDLPISAALCGLVLVGVQGAEKLATPDPWARFLGCAISWKEFWDVLAYCWPNLHKLGLRDIGIPEGAAAALGEVAARHWPQLRGLGLCSCRLGDAGLKALVERGAMKWQKLEQLGLQDNSIGAAGMKVLAAGQHWTQLYCLCLSRNAIGDEGLLALVSTAPESTHLEHLLLSGTEISADGISEVAHKAAPYWKGLKVLDLSDNPAIGDREIFAVTKLAASNWLLLEDLRLMNVGMGPAGVWALAAAACYWRALKKMYISNLQIQPRDVLNLCQAAAPHWKQLEQLDCG